MLSAAIVILAAGNSQVEVVPAVFCQSFTHDESFVIDAGDDGQISKSEVEAIGPCLEQYLAARTDQSVATCSYAESGNRFVINSDAASKLSGQCRERFTNALESFGLRVTKQIRDDAERHYGEVSDALADCRPADFAAALDCVETHFDNDMKAGIASDGARAWSHTRLAILARTGFRLGGNSRLSSTMATLGFKHPDDMSHAIIGAYHAKLTGQTFDLMAAAERSSRPAVIDIVPSSQTESRP